MRAPDTTTHIREDGLRYRSKSAGSMFNSSPAGTISCIFCGQHRPRSALKNFKLAGANQVRCAQECRPARKST